MGLLNKKNLDKARRLAEKNAAKVVPMVEKATRTVNDKTGGKYARHLDSVDRAARSLSSDQKPDPGTRTVTDSETATDQKPDQDQGQDQDPTSTTQ